MQSLWKKVEIPSAFPPQSAGMFDNLLITVENFFTLQFKKLLRGECPDRRFPQYNVGVDHDPHFSSRRSFLRSSSVTFTPMAMPTRLSNTATRSGEGLVSFAIRWPFLDCRGDGFPGNILSHGICQQNTHAGSGTDRGRKMCCNGDCQSP